VLFFTAPPQASEPRAPLLHTAKYLAYKSKRRQLLADKRKRDAENASAELEARKRAKSEEVVLLRKRTEAAKKAALETMEEALAEATVEEFKALYGEGWREGMERELKALEGKQAEAGLLREERERVEKEWVGRERKELSIRGLGSWLELGVRP
jgi:chromatin structure-remodeling complex subunit RSC1/2